jgi:hypothetical protein
VDKPLSLIKRRRVNMLRSLSACTILLGGSFLSHSFRQRLDGVSPNSWIPEISLHFSSCNVFPGRLAKTLSLYQLFHYAEQFVFGFKTDARNLRKANVAVFHGEAVCESTKGLEDSRVRFVASQP